MKLFNFFRDMITQLKLSFQLIIRDRITVFVFVASCCCFFFLCATMNFSAENQSRIPVGLANLDIVEETNRSTELSLELMERVKESASFRITEGNVEELTQALKNGELNCIFVINKGYEKSLKKGSTHGIITLYKSEGNESASMLADIFAGEMMEQVTLQKSYLAYGKLDFVDTNMLSETEYAAYVDRMRDDDEFVFAFDVTLSETKEAQMNFEKLNNAILYRQIIAGIFAMLLSFVILFSYTYVCMEKEQGILKRKRLTLLSRMAMDAGSLIAVLLSTGIISVIFVLCVCYYTKSYKVAIPLLALAAGYAAIMSIFFQILAHVTNGIVSYQIIGAILILLLGMMGFCSIVDGIAFKNLAVILENTPNGWFIQRFVDIIIRN